MHVFQLLVFVKPRFSEQAASVEERQPRRSSDIPYEIDSRIWCERAGAKKTLLCLFTKTNIHDASD